MRMCWPPFFPGWPRRGSLASSWVQFFLWKQYPTLKAAWNYSFSSQHPLFSGSEIQEGRAKVGDALEESHNTNKIVVRLMRKVREVGRDENEVRPLSRLLLVFMWEPGSGWLVARREEGSAVGFGRNTNIYMQLLKCSCKEKFNNLHRMSKMILLVGLWVCLEAHACTYANRLRKQTLGLLVKVIHN